MKYTQELCNKARLKIRYAKGDDYNEVAIECADLEALLDEIERLQQENRWMSMDSAPKDGTFVLLLQDKGVYKAAWQQNYGVVCRRDDPFEWCIDASYQDEQGYFSTVDKPEKWRPLPPAPDEEG